MKRIIVSLFALSMSVLLVAQSPSAERLQLSVNKMDGKRQDAIERSKEKYIGENGMDERSIESVGAAAFGAVVDVALTEFVKLLTLYDEQKKEWHSMIERESLYQNDISSINEINDFYSELSTVGAMDPSGFAFNGVTICDSIAEGPLKKEVMRMVCHVDTSEEKLYELWKYGTFSLVLDTFIFHPYQGHLPNLAANGIRGEIKKERDKFDFAEREFYNVAVKLSLTSSWVNQVAQVMKDVNLGEFMFAVRLDTSNVGADSVYKYIRGEGKGSASVTGRSFIVPRSCIVSSNNKPIWGVGAFKITAKLTESSGFIFDKKRNKRAAKWLSDYYDLRYMQKSAGKRMADYFVTLFNQKAGVVVKTTASSAIMNPFNSWINGSASQTTSTSTQSSAPTAGGE